MAARSIGTGKITFGLVSIPVKLFTAASSEAVSLNTLHTCGSRVKQQLRCAAEDIPIEHADTVKGFEYAKDQYVQITASDLESLKAAATSELALEEFVPADTVDAVAVEKSYFLGPDKGGDAGYATLALALERTRKVGVGRFTRAGRTPLVIVRPYRGGLLLQEAYYAHEVRSWDDVPKAEVTPSAEHVRAAELLIAQLAGPAFDASAYRDEWAEKVRALVEKKVAGEEIVAAPPPPAGPVLDLLEALQRSVAANDAKSEAAAPRAKKGPKKAEPREKAPAAKKRGRSSGG